jgi:hypothetical protein
MLRHICIDPQDPYAQEEVVVAFERIASKFRLVSAINSAGDDVLSDLLEVQMNDLILELADADPTNLDFAFLASQEPGGLHMGGH